MLNTQTQTATPSLIPAFLHNLFHWGFTQVEGTAKGSVDDAKVEANPVIQVAVQAATNAATSVLMNHVGSVMGVEPTAQGIQGALIGIVENASAVPAEAKEPLKLLLGGLLAGADFLAPAIAAPASKPAVTSDVTEGPEDKTDAGKVAAPPVGGFGQATVPPGESA